MPFAVDYSITIGTVAEIVSIVGGGLIFLGVMKRAMKDMEKEIEKMQAQMVDFSKALITLAVQNTRIDNLEEDFRELRRGKGFIDFTPPRSPSK